MGGIEWIGVLDQRQVAFITLAGKMGPGTATPADDPSGFLQGAERQTYLVLGDGAALFQTQLNDPLTPESLAVTIVIAQNAQDGVFLRKRSRCRSGGKRGW